jgi:peptidoglycan/xylan/chitin deacetylase (PgdA/CDA1 family)
MLKRLINLSGSIFVSVYDKIGDVLGQIFGRQPSESCVVLAYHSVLPKQRSKFAKQMDDLVRFARPVHANVSSLPAGGGRFAAVTFDDGLENIIENALPELRKRNIPATLFIVTGVLGKNPEWEYFGGDDPTQQRAMTADQLSQLPSDLVTIGSHTMTHPVLPAIDEEALKNELEGSRTKLMDMVKREVHLFSFPYGAFDSRAIEACRKAGYRRVFTALPVWAFSQPNEFVTGRVGATPDDWPLEYKLKLSGAYRWLPKAFTWKRKLLSMLGRGGATPLQSETPEKRVA